MNSHANVLPLPTFLGGLLFLLFISPTFAVAQTSTNENSQDSFLRNLRVGDRGVDVQILQKVLNSSPETKLGEIGPGAPGEETTYFGELTKSAVVRFQEKYAVEILFPIQLVQGTGFVGPMTRKKLNEAKASMEIGPNGGSSSSSSGVGSGSATIVKPKIISITPSSIQNGDEITINGEGFTDDNTIKTSFAIYEHIASTDGKTLKIKIYSEQIAFITNTPNAPTSEVFDWDHEASENTSNTENQASLLPKTFVSDFVMPVAVFVENKNGLSEQFIIELRPKSSLSSNNNETIFSKIVRSAEKALSTISEPKIAQARHSRFNWFSWAQGIANGMWSGFMSQGIAASVGGGSPGAYPNFGGRVVMTFPCTCPIPGIAYFILPAGGLPGPYGVTMFEYGLVVKQWYSIFPGNNVVGKSYGIQTPTCGIGILAWCFTFQVNPTMVVGTSAVPGI